MVAEEIVLTSLRDNEPIDVSVCDLVKITDGANTFRADHSKPSPCSDVLLFDHHTGKEHLIRVKESPKEIGALITGGYYAEHQKSSKQGI